MAEFKSVFLNLTILTILLFSVGKGQEENVTESSQSSDEPIQAQTTAPTPSTEVVLVESVSNSDDPDQVQTTAPTEVILAESVPNSNNLASFPDIVTDANSKSIKSEILKAIVLNEAYDKYVRPAGVNGSGPTVVSVNLFVRNVENIDDILMEYTAQLTFRQEWIDPRLKYAHLHKVEYIQLATSTSIWVPDIFFSNEKSGSMHELMVPNYFGRIYPNGRVLASYRITLVLSCPMDLHYYPMDKQHCFIKMASYGWTEKAVIIKWLEKMNSTQINKFNLPRFKLHSHALESCLSVTQTGNYSCIQLRLTFERQFGYYLIKIYAPCFMLVLVSWISFWLEPTATEARISLAITAVLTVVTQTDGINQGVPPASYIKAVDVWTFMIQFMVFAAVLQFAYVNYLASYHWKRMARRLNITDEDEWTKTGCELRRQTEKKAKRVDNVSKILFPVVFALFNAAYWVAYLGTKQGR